MFLNLFMLAPQWHLSYFPSPIFLFLKTLLGTYIHPFKFSSSLNHQCAAILVGIYLHHSKFPSDHELIFSMHVYLKCILPLFTLHLFAFHSPADSKSANVTASALMTDISWIQVYAKPRNPLISVVRFTVASSRLSTLSFRHCQHAHLLVSDVAPNAHHASGTPH